MTKKIVLVITPKIVFLKFLPFREKETSEVGVVVVLVDIVGECFGTSFEEFDQQSQNQL